MLNRNTYSQMKKKYGNVGSWAVWCPPADTPKSNTSNMDWIEDKALLSKLNTGFVFVGLNMSKHKNASSPKGVWANFHSADTQKQNDYKLRYALMGTKYWGSYITDLIKKYKQVDSNKVTDYLRQNPHVVGRNVKGFVTEIKLLGNNLVLVALGDKVYRLLNKHLKHKFTVVKVKHYSSRIGKEIYRKEVLGVLDKIAADK